MKFILFTVAALVVMSLLAGALLAVGNRISSPCQERGGVLLRTYNGLVCARLEIIPL